MSCNIACITSQRPPQRPKDVVCRITRRGALACIGAALCVLNYRRHCHSFCVLLLARIVGHSCVWLVHTECTRMLFVVMDVSLVCTAVSARSLHHLHDILVLLVAARLYRTGPTVALTLHSCLGAGMQCRACIPVVCALHGVATVGPLCRCACPCAGVCVFTCRWQPAHKKLQLQT